MCRTSRFPLKYSRLVCTGCWELVSWYLITTDGDLLPGKDGNIVGETRSVQQAKEIHDRVISRWAD